ncbi:conserved hypothetical protein [Methanocella paludicola SANAE]|uniref:BioF2-like acetyltransferase domain-containing protein n=1 Tax=Methanocella paludicola (strain DSM 17711 / JCM 13418 / NBRC 101707 / SANAE) TaxID=304371 RepID=D1YWM0_METPS|nr:GNAT family N-acetyltransferase [Methanocella paludicola]BAI60842.1 conserved hypothetical protein [Methanocella paludicola SANAE]
MDIELVDDHSLWDRFIDESPYGTLFHKWDFLKTIEKYSGYRLYPYAIYTGNMLISLFPIFIKSYMGFKFVFSPPPGSGVPFMGFALAPSYTDLKQSKKEHTLTTIMDCFNDEISTISPNYVSISMPPRYIDIRPFKWSGYDAEIEYNYIIGLDRPVETIWDGVSKVCRKNIKDFENRSVSVEESKDVYTFYDMVKKRYAQQGLKYTTYSAEYLEELIRAFPNNLKLYYIYLDSEISGAYLTYQYKDRFMLWVGGVNMLTHLPVNEYMQWELIKKAKENNFKEFMNQGANIKRLCQFKSKFNPSLDTCFFIHKKDNIGRLAEWTYATKKMLIKPHNMDY